MKKSIKMMMAFAASVLTLVACNKEEKEITIQGEKETFTVNFTASSDEFTKVYFGDKTEEGKYPVYWNGGERVAVIAIPVDADNNFMVDGVQAFMGENAPVAEAINEGRNARFSVNVEKNEDAASWIFSARCPTENFFTYGVAASGLPFLTYAIPTVQTPLSSAPDPSAMYLSSFSAAQEADGVVNVDFKFRHGMVNYLKMSLKNLDESATIKEVRLALEPNDSGIEGNAFGDFYYEFEYIPEELRATGHITGGVNEATIKTSSRDDIWVVMNVGCQIRGKDMTVTVVTDKGDYVKTINFGSYSLSSLGGQVGSFGINFADIEPVVENNTYVLVTSNLSDWSGEYLIVSEDKARIADTKLYSNRLSTTDVFTLSSDGASIDADSQNQFTISPASDGKYYIKNAAGEYLYLPDINATGLSYTSDLSDAPTGYAQWSLSIEPSGFATINYGMVGKNQRHIGDNGDSDFRAYTGSNTCYLYKNIGASGKTHQTLTFPEESYQVGVDDSFTAPELSGAQTTVTYESSETSVATVDPSTGAIEIVGPGSTVITATAEETDSYYSASASYTLTVIGNNVYQKVMTAPEDWSGNYLIVYETGTDDGAKVFNGVDAASDYVDATISQNTIAYADGMAIITIAPMTDGYSLMVNGGDNDGKYMKGTSVSNTIGFGTSAQLNTISIDSDAMVSIESNTSVFRFNGASGNDRFRYFKSTNTSYPLVCLYKYNGGSPIPQKTLESIEISGEYPIEFTVGDEFSHEGMTVTATYDDESTADVTASASFTGYDMATSGEQTVTVSYTEGGVSKNTTYQITVNEQPSYSVTLGDTSDILTETAGGQGVTLPTRDAKNGWTFYGWCTSNIETETSTKPEIISAGTYHPTTNITLYPVYYKGSGAAQWHKVDSPSTAGTYALLTTDGHAFNGTISSGHGQATTGAFSFTNDYASSAPAGTLELTFTASGSGYTVYNSEKGYLYATAASSGKLSWHSTEDSYWYYSENFIYYASSARLRSYNNNSFRTYGSNNGDIIGFAIKESSVSYISNPPANIPVTGVSLNQNSATLSVGGTVTLTATVAPANASNQNVTWSTSNSSVATVNNGVVTAVAGGNADITVTTEDGNFTATCSVTVSIPTFSSLAALVEAGAPTSTGYNVNVTITDEEIQSIFVTSKGYRSGIFLKSGNQDVEIYCSNVPENWVAGGTVSGTLENCVWKLFNSTWELCPTSWDALTYTAPAPVAVSSITLNNTAELSVGGTLTLTATVNPSNATNKSLTWSSDNESVATVDQTGLVTAVAAGTAHITAAANDGSGVVSGACSVTVTAGSGGGDPVTLTFDLSSNPDGWPTTNSTTTTNYTYNLNDVDYTFALKNVKCNSGYLMLTATAALGLPAIEGMKLTKVVAKNSSGCSTSVNVGVSSSDSSASYISGGAAQKWATTSSTYTYNLTGTANNTVYYLYVTSKNAQIVSLELTYE